MIVFACFRIDAQISHEVGVLLAQRRDDLVKACKGKPELLMTKVKQEADSEETGENVSPLVASQ